MRSQRQQSHLRRTVQTEVKRPRRSHPGRHVEPAPADSVQSVRLGATDPVVHGHAAEPGDPPLTCMGVAAEHQVDDVVGQVVDRRGDVAQEDRGMSVAAARQRLGQVCHRSPTVVGAGQMDDVPVWLDPYRLVPEEADSIGAELLTQDDGVVVARHGVAPQGRAEGADEAADQPGDPTPVAGVR